MIRWANGNDQEPAPQTKKASSSEEVRASALRLSSQMALSLRLLPWGRLHLLLRLLAR